MSFSLLKCLSVLQVPEYAVIEKTLDKDDDGVTASSHIIYSFTKLLLLFFIVVSDMHVSAIREVGL